MSVPPPDAEIVVRRHWNSPDRAVYRRDEIDVLHWSDFSGGAGARSPRLMVYGYVQCDSTLYGEVAHSAAHGSCPHRIKICLVAKDSERSVMRWAKHVADKQRERRAGAS